MNITYLTKHVNSDILNTQYLKITIYKPKLQEILGEVKKAI